MGVLSRSREGADRQVNTLCQKKRQKKRTGKYFCSSVFVGERRGELCALARSPHGFSGGSEERSASLVDNQRCCCMCSHSEGFSLNTQGQVYRNPGGGAELAGEGVFHFTR